MAQSSLQSNWNASPGWKTKGTYVPRPLERGPGGTMEPWTPGEFDLVAEDFVALAAELGA